MQRPGFKIAPVHFILWAVLIFCAIGLHAFWSIRPKADATNNNENRFGTIAAQLAQHSGLIVDSSDVAWLGQPPSSSMIDLLSWRTLVFLGRKDDASPADFYRIDVKGDSGQLIAAKNLLNLSHSPAGDEFEMVVFGKVAAVKNRVLGQVRSVTLFDFSTDFELEGETSSLAGVLGRITNRLEEGQVNGIARTSIRFSQAPTSVRVAFNEKGALSLTWEDAAAEVFVAHVTPGEETTDSDKIVVTCSVKLEKQPVLWLVDTVRSFSWIGPGPIEWAEGRFFALKDFFKRTRYKMMGDDVEQTETSDPGTAMVQLSLPEGIEIGEKVDGEVWPPPPFDPPAFKRRIAGEGVWKPVSSELVKPLPNAPPAFYRTITRPDVSRPYVKVHLFAMDMRQLSLHMVGGYEDPKSTTGSSGTGRFPRKKEVLKDVVAAFNGAFKTMHGGYGMMVEENVLLPPKDEAATVASLSDRSMVMGTWPKGMAIPESMVSYRQNMDPLIEGDVVNPKRRYLWGFTLDEDITKMNTVRSGICISDMGYMLYAWGEDLTAQTLGKAMIAGGCSYGMHLDMNPFHTAYIFYQFDVEEYTDGERPGYESEVAISGMRYSPHRYVNGAPKDFFYLTRKKSEPGPGWSAEGLAQPYPAGVPAMFKKEADSCTLIAIDLTRSYTHLAHGTYPEYLSPAGRLELPKDKASDLLVDIALGPWSSMRGQLANRSVLASLVRGKGTIGVNQRGDTSVATWPLASDFSEAVQGRWLDEETGEANRIALLKKGKWLYVGIGALDRLKKAFSPLGGRAVAFGTDAFVPDVQHIGLRTDHGMADLAGADITETDAMLTHLRLYANPQPMGVRRLETLFENLSEATVDRKSENKE